MSKPIVIIGAGVIGCLLGMILKKRDIPFTILEKNKELKKIPYRTVALTKDTVLFLNSLDKKIDINRWATPVSRMELYQDHDLTMTLNKNDNDIVLPTEGSLPNQELFPSKPRSKGIVFYEDRVLELNGKVSHTITASETSEILKQLFA